MAILIMMTLHPTRPAVNWDGRKPVVPADMLAKARAIVAAAEAVAGELHPWCRAELLKEKTGWYTDEIYAAVQQLSEEDYPHSGH